LIATTMEGAAVDPEFMQKMNTLKWAKGERFIKTPEYETRKRALFDNHFGDPASLAGAKSLRKKTSTGSGEEDTSSGNSSASDEEKASSAGSKKKERSTQSKDTAKLKASRMKKRRFNKTSQVSEQMEEYCVTALWVHNADFTGEAVKLIIPYKYDRLLVSVLVALLSVVCTGSLTRMIRR
jgi:hypothetical protein